MNSDCSRLKDHLEYRLHFAPADRVFFFGAQVVCSGGGRSGVVKPLEDELFKIVKLLEAEVEAAGAVVVEGQLTKDVRKASKSLAVIVVSSSQSS